MSDVIIAAIISSLIGGSLGIVGTLIAVKPPLIKKSKLIENYWNWSNRKAL